MTPLTVIIPSRSAENLGPCLRAVEKNEPTARVVIVDDGVDWKAFGPSPLGLDATSIEGAKPFVFARNINRGIDFVRDRLDGPASGGRYSDVVLLNDDAILETPGGFSSMQSAAAEFHRDVALIASTTNLVNNPDQWRKPGSTALRPAGRLPYTTFACVAFVCVLIPGRTLETIGLLDERYSAYGWEDVDYCRRIHEAGRRIVIDDLCFVDHGSLTSTFRGDPRAAGKIEDGKRIYLNKWGKL